MKPSSTPRPVRHSFSPDYVSAETLAYRLDCARSTIDDYVRRDMLPRPRKIGNLQRWRWVDVEEWIAKHNGEPLDPSWPEDRVDDPYLVGVKRAATA